MPRSLILFSDQWLFRRGAPVLANEATDAINLEDVDVLERALAPMGSHLRPCPGSSMAEVDATFAANQGWTLPRFDDGRWTSVTLPHDWAIEGPFDPAAPGETGKLPWVGVGYYRKRFAVSEDDLTRKICLRFDGAMSHALVWCNGAFVGGWRYGYTSWSIDLSGHLVVGEENVIAVRLENLPESSRWYPGAGLYRNVWMEKRSPLHVESDGVTVTVPSLTGQEALLIIETVLFDGSGGAASRKVDNSIYEPNQHLVPVHLRHRIYEAGPTGHPMGDPVAESEASEVGIQDGFSAHSSISLRLSKPRRWDVNDPHRYVAETLIWREEGKLLDRVLTLFGVRRAEFVPNDGFWLNGRRVPLQGVCLHHDLGALGSAVDPSALRRQILKLQQMGCNAIRTTHNPPTPELLDLCDELGLLVIDEAFDCWAIPKKDNDYGRWFEKWYERDLRAMVRRDRHHPSVILWSIGNEIAELWRPEGWKLARHLSSIVREEDPTRPTTAGFNWKGAAFDGMQAAVDVTGFNYKPDLYNEFHRRNPTRPVYGSETSSCVSTRDFYIFPVSPDRLEGRAEFQVSSYDLYTPEWAFVPDDEFRGLDEAPCAAGEFVWTGIDYLGEPTPYNADLTNLLNYTDPGERARIAAELERFRQQCPPSRSSYFGILDLAGFRKDRFYLYQSRWRPQLPVAHLLPHWDWPGREGEVTPVHAYSNGEEAELFLNGRSLGIHRRQPHEYRFIWADVRYEPGELRLEVRREGKAWATAVRTTPGVAARLVLEIDEPDLLHHAPSTVFVRACLCDAAGTRLPRATTMVRFSLQGPGGIIATDNGDPTRLEPFSAQSIPLFGGWALVYLRYPPGTRPILVADTEGLAPARLELPFID